MKCKKSESASAVSIYLLEPKTCEYVLGVESPLGNFDYGFLSQPLTFKVLRVMGVLGQS